MIDKTDLNTLIANKYYNRTATHSVNDNWAEALRVAEEIKQLFVEQACEAIDAIEEGLQPLIGNYNNGISKAEAKQAIRDKFK